ncbi:hypothetical protein [Vibrio gazogenes]|uniref:Uncharacterized protein n=2 Tax=Vibrio gazogenes TaxID=687 RepID=A0A1M5HHR0_VIBGA|nr:hypothetical protein [Vibrio gazogenes]USP13265.1 hypothetical protein MKS89_12720 [Vibrio gazogenes]SHG15467.1 hypothetical protein SAMN02745781_04101 [Vibrio gazogenes DSM 21264] [Vibrio gazogenes DSM 21264 = NBRC 103151]SJN56716.1 hypothetical protein BQ6471_02174 [Vibrio gazogenes]
MRRVRITRIIWVPSGYHIVRRTANRTAKPRSSSKIATSHHTISQPQQAAEALTRPTEPDTPLVTPSETQVSPESHAQTGGYQTETTSSAIASFPEQCNPYREFLQHLPHYLDAMPTDTFVTHSPAQAPHLSPSPSGLPENTALPPPPLTERPREPRDTPAQSSDSDSAHQSDDENDDDEAHRHLTKHRWPIPHLRHLTGIRHVLRASAVCNPASLPATTSAPIHTTSSENSHYASIQPSFSTSETLGSLCHDSTWRKRMRQLLFRLCEAADGRHFAFLTDQPDVEDLFDNGYKVAYKSHDRTTGNGILARWKKAYSVKSVNYEQLPEQDGLPDGVQSAFDMMIRNLIPGVDIFFCDYNLAIEADLPICNHMMEQYRSTDFVLFSCEELIGNDPTTQPYMVSYAAPRYQNGGNTSSQHRIYCKTDAFAFCQSIHAIVVQREKDALSGGHIRTEVDSYVGEPPVEAAVAEQVINRFVEALPQYNSSVKALKAPQTE